MKLVWIGKVIEFVVLTTGVAITMSGMLKSW